MKSGDKELLQHEILRYCLQAGNRKAQAYYRGGAWSGQCAPACFYHLAEAGEQAGYKNSQMGG